jgi:RNA polymerase-binding protein DksA
MSPARKATSARSRASSKTTKRAAKRAPVKKTAAKKTAARKTSTKSAKKTAKSSVKKTAAKKTAVKKPVARKTAATKAGAKKPVAKKPVAKKTAVKPAPKKKTTTVTKPPAPTAAATKPSIKKPISRPAPPAPPKKKVRAAKFDKAQLAKIRASLADKQVELEARQRELEEGSFDSTQSDLTGEVGLDEDFADAGTATFERERDLSIRNNIRDLIDQVARAMQRIDEGTYGTCERCGQPIDATRLRELPHASLCLDCKRREERAR